ncbi:hypothetical protein HBH56_182120 [Parastagonospora nodorum]|uniref:Uncharacterized protein n=2 Tax=Phaeosphaeria nodorum (strain SN15 / ATCC MYA-4574 / FGSC 10173) TaxID=321614 RepID=A0A7U2FFC2_PHANO|nr:hypothetical protein SNOG_12959 [Parastagonospora nodorum SN15]KAH3907873.1 hypothetical protein HBH56_182120 [Parastagonospora nodorum]EAT79759.1 hypothetical protein SNOG_12959 [Parastagonospora nodorum SN15]KAH3926012.1 hypothetical protein HBH54_171270 [Parastagonospora nodorum]KAH4133671.1 hypothetical protein HBH45_174990 [Parastagonospora nodorum]KAH4153500.1 hypothetical protein HBH44_152840 [Parastagonospora nodorum]
MASTAFAYLNQAPEGKVQARAVADEAEAINLEARQRTSGASSLSSSAAAMLLPLAGMVAYGL